MSNEGWRDTDKLLMQVVLEAYKKTLLLELKAWGEVVELFRNSKKPPS